MTLIQDFEEWVRQEMDGQESFTMPIRKIVCPRCRGEGKHVNPAIDGNGITESDRQEWADDDFMEDYLRGVYDVRCEECHGDNVVDEPVEEDLSAEIYNAWVDFHRQHYEVEAMYEAERRMGA